jgi:hypothetical protein
MKIALMNGQSLFPFLYTFLVTSSNMSVMAFSPDKEADASILPRLSPESCPEHA